MKKVIFLLAAMFLLGNNPMMAQQENKVEQTSKQAEKEAKKAEKEAKKAAEKAEKEAKKAAEKAEKEAKKAKEEAIQNAQFEVALQAIQNRKFILKADDVDFKRGHSSHVNDNTNFVMLNGDEASIQFNSNKALAGPNGIGGITVEGKASDIEMKTDKKGNILFEMNVHGSGVSAKVSFRMNKGSNYCSATVTPNFHNNRITFNGELTPYGSGKVFKGNAR